MSLGACGAFYLLQRDRSCGCERVNSHSIVLYAEVWSSLGCFDAGKSNVSRFNPLACGTSWTESICTASLLACTKHTIDRFTNLYLALVRNGGEAL